MSIVKFTLPDVGDFNDLNVIEILAKVGDTVQAEQSVITVESDKASMEIPAPCAGIIKSLTVKLGDKVNQGDLIGEIEAQEAEQSAQPAAKSAAAAPAQAAKPTEPAPVATPATAPASPTVSAPAQPVQGESGYLGKLPYASPSVRKYARELGVPLEQVAGTGNKGRIVQDDVKNFVKNFIAGKAGSAAGAATNLGGGLDLLPWPKVDFTKFGEIERKELSRIKKISGANLHRNWVMIPHITNHENADITELEQLRQQLNKENAKQNIKVTMLAFMIKATVASLKKYPEFNSSLDGDALIYKKYYNIGFAADTPQGLVVPVIKNADTKSILEISQEMSDLAKQARDGKLSPAAMTGGTFTISSLGGIGGSYFTPIVNAPEVAILGVGRSTMQPTWDGEKFAPRLILPLSLSYDHRVIDGAAAARFNAYFASIMSDFRRAFI